MSAKVHAGGGERGCHPPAAGSGGVTRRRRGRASRPRACALGAPCARRAKRVTAQARHAKRVTAQPETRECRRVAGHGASSGAKRRAATHGRETATLTSRPASASRPTGARAPSAAAAPRLHHGCAESTAAPHTSHTHSPSSNTNHTHSPSSNSKPHVLPMRQVCARPANVQRGGCVVGSVEHPRAPSCRSAISRGSAPKIVGCLPATP